MTKLEPSNAPKEVRQKYYEDGKWVTYVYVPRVDLDEALALLGEYHKDPVSVGTDRKAGAFLAKHKGDK